MGSITKPAKPRVVTRVVQAPKPAPPPPAPAEPEVETPTAEEQESEARKQSLLRRSRGRSGTILTGLRGFLTPANQASDRARKTLLGE